MGLVIAESTIVRGSKPHGQPRGVSTANPAHVQMWRSFRARTSRLTAVRAGILTGAVLFLLLLAGFAKMARDYVNAASWVDHTNSVIAEINVARTSLSQAKRRSNPRRAQAGIAQLRAELGNLRDLTTDNAIQRSNLLSLQVALDQLAANPADRSIAAQTDLILDQMRDEEYRLLIARNRVNNAALHKVETFMLVLWILTCGVGTLTALAASRQGRRRKEAERDLRKEKEDFAQLAQKLSVVSAGSERIQSAQSEAELQEAVRDVLQDLVPSSEGLFALVESPSGTVVIRASWGSDLPVAATAVILCTAMETGRVMISREGTVECSACVSHSGAGEHVCIPVRTATEQLGLIHIRTRSGLDQRQIHAVTIFASHVALGLTNLRMRDKLREQSVRDGLTGLFNRLYFDETLKREFLTSVRAGKPLSLLLLDVDHFKRFNDTHGHLAGDQVLRSVAATLASSLRGNDVIARYGGEEFAVILLGADLQSAYEKAELLRRVVETSPLHLADGTTERITLSIGVAEFNPAQTPSELIGTADAALYKAKRAGRNRTFTAMECFELVAI